MFISLGLARAAWMLTLQITNDIVEGFVGRRTSPDDTPLVEVRKL